MKSFMCKNFLLKTETARTLYHDYAAKLPIIDYHCHISPKEVYEDRTFENITQMWLEADHYKWRIMRSNGVEEKYITGDASDLDKFTKFAESLEKAIGNPMYHWCHLELKNYFNYKGILNKDTAKEVFEHCSKVIKEEKLSVRKLIKKSNVSFIGTTDEATDSLEWHKKIIDEKIEGLTISPSFRPDKIININKPIWKENIEKLEGVLNTKFNTFADLKDAIVNRIKFFTENGCTIADHGLDYIVFAKGTEDELEAIYQKGLNNEVISELEANKFITELLVLCAREYTKFGIVMQLHFNCLRNPNSTMYNTLGADSGFDVINTVNCTNALASLLDELFKTNSLPKTIIYSLNPADNAYIGSLIGAFQKPGTKGYVQHGSAWWFNDTKTGMQEQMTSLANLGLLGNFVGMLTDSRSFLSYARHEYFRRIACDLIGTLVENGEFPADLKQISTLASDISYYNAKRYFNIK